ncbi:MmpS family transport accessory protein [[Mycobacterium] wendilense]|uniref:MmpS family transport accessory protein n=1 Tax=[Mycobacterium] wendilense TaxID=3064284 RepID=A0ABN9P793_9MYCO|nr:MmpS family transport accessory protein [Mycolicibacterium sp. MU0050]CAJ1587178.1 MmpS family transport accessory protein [Mycolicibacterium sp. MU0050]
MKRLWIPLLALVVFSAGGFTVSRLHGIFGSEDRPTYASSEQAQTEAFKPKKLTYEVFGSPGAVANISYFDAETDPQFVENVSLPWSMQFEVYQTTTIGSIMAQGDGSTIGCRISVDDELKEEKVSNQVNAFTSCLLQAA